MTELEAAKEAVISRLAALEVARKEAASKRKEEAADQSDPKESIASFLAGFASQQQLCRTSLAELRTINAASESDMQARLNQLTELAFTVGHPHACCPCEH